MLRHLDLRSVQSVPLNPPYSELTKKVKLTGTKILFVIALSWQMN
jgi:hypothetical protein